MLNEIKQNIVNNLKNIPGWRTSRKIVIIECDDWGSIGMPSNGAYERLLASGVNVGNRRWNKYDTLETGEDLEQLYDTLNCVKDSNNRPAVMTPFTIVANPDFKKIRAGGFTEYHYEKFTETLRSYYPGSDVFRMWKEGMAAGIFVPELHGREHIAVNLWMEKLREGNSDLRMAFDQGFASLDIPGIPPPARGFRAAFYFRSDSEKPFLIASINESILLFRDIFEYNPRMFVPPNGIFHPDFDEVLSREGVEFMYTGHALAYPVGGGEIKYRRFTTGQKGPMGLTYYTRNCSFEPSDETYKGIELTIKQIEASFRWRKPANISTHRANYTGGLNPDNRKKGLSELRKLLTGIVKRWPEVEFMSSWEAHELLRTAN